MQPPPMASWATPQLQSTTENRPLGPPGKLGDVWSPPLFRIRYRKVVPKNTLTEGAMTAAAVRPVVIKQYMDREDGVPHVYRIPT